MDHKSNLNGNTGKYWYECPDCDWKSSTARSPDNIFLETARLDHRINALYNQVDRACPNCGQYPAA